MDIPDENRAMLERAVAYARAIYAAQRLPRPFGMVEEAGGDVSVIALDDPEDLESLASAMRWSCVRRQASRTAAAYERLEFDATDERTMRELEAMERRGEPLDRHPAARPVVIVSVESEIGLTWQTLSMRRRHRSMAGLDARVPEHEPWGREPALDPMLSGHYLRSSLRSDPEIVAWAAEMDEAMARSAITDFDVEARNVH